MFRILRQWAKNSPNMLTIGENGKIDFHEFVCPYNFSTSGKRIWLDVCNGELRKTILLELRYLPIDRRLK